jgi:ribokinase
VALPGATATYSFTVAYGYVSVDPVDIVVLGSANADLVVTVPWRPSAGETVLGSDTAVLPGGKGANTAVAAGRIGGRVAFAGAVGTDQYGELLLESLRSSGVDTSLVRRRERPTGIAYITVTPDGENAIVVSPGANATLTNHDIEFGTARVLVASLEVPVPVVEHAVALAAARGVRPVLNLSPAAHLSAETLSLLDPLVVNEHEAAWLLGGEPDARRLLELGPRSVVITLGARGAVVADYQATVEIPAPKVDPVDTTGAGDAFAGALAVGLAAGNDLVAAAELAVRVAAISVTRPGAQPSYPTLAEL